MKPETIRIAIADDHKLFCEGLRLIIQSNPRFELLFEASDGQQLLDQVALSDPKPEVILLDLRMPVKDGIETTRELKILHPEIKILILTMIDQEDYILHLLDLGANGYLLKNLSAGDIHVAIETVAEKGFFFNDHTTQVMLQGLKRKRAAAPQLETGNKISSREIEVCRLMADGFTTSEIAERLFISSRTVETHRKNLMEKLGVKNSAGIIYRAVKEGLLG